MNITLVACKDQREKVHIINKHVYHQSDMQIQAFIMKNRRPFRYVNSQLCEYLWFKFMAPRLESNMTANAF